MAQGNVERDEVVELILHLGAGCQGKTHSAEKLGQFVGDLHENVPVADLGAKARLGDVYRSLNALVRGQRRPPRLEGGGHAIFERVDLLADDRLLIFWRLAQKAHQPFDVALDAEEFDAELFKLDGIGDGGQFLVGLTGNRLDLLRMRPP